MTAGSSNIVDIEMEKRRSSASGLAMAFFMGEYEEDANGFPKEKWIWLPLSKIEIEFEPDSVLCVVSMPLWLATDKGLV